MIHMRRLITLLRSPKLAIWLLVGVVAYAVLAMSIPQRGLDAEKAAEWQAANPTLVPVVRAFGLDDAFSSPLFLAPMVLLIAVTASCAWSRTRTARGLLRSLADSERVIDTLRRHPAVVSPTVPRGGGAAALDAVESAFRRRGFRVRRGPRYMEAERAVWGALGSPVFHWALVALVVVIAAGTLTRSEGVLDVPVGGRVADATESYQGMVQEGALFPGHSGLTLSARDLLLSTVVGGVDRGYSAVIELYRGQDKVAEGRTYPNAPLRYRSLLVHRTRNWGYAPLVSVETSTGLEVTRSHVLIDESLQGSGGVGPGRLQLTGVDGGIVIAVEIPYSPSAGSSARQLAEAIRVSAASSGQATSTPVVLAEGESAPLPGGLSLRFIERGHFVRVSVVDDWSVPFIYALFVLAAAALAVALFVPVRRVWVAVVEQNGSERLHAHWWRPQRDPAFLDQVERMLRDGAEVGRQTGAERGSAPALSGETFCDAEHPSEMSWWAHLLWIPAGALLQFAVAAVFSGALQWPRRFFLIPYVLLGSAFAYAFLRWNRLSIARLVRHSWRKGLVGAAIVGAVVVWLVLAGTASARLSGWQLAVDLLWSGVAYGAIDALLLSVIPVLATYRGLSGFAWAKPRRGRVLVRAAGFGASLLAAAVYHVGFAEYRGTEALGAVVGNAIFSLGYVLTGSPLTPVLSHIAMHVAAILYGPAAAHQLPPHYF